jgi:hypothetical protein
MPPGPISKHTMRSSDRQTGSARRDALRRYLCGLPVTKRTDFDRA